MPEPGEDDGPDRPRHGRGDRLDLREGPVLVVLTLKDEEGAADRPDRLDGGEAAERGVPPRLAPGPEDGLGLAAVVPGEPGREVRRPPGLDRRVDPAERRVLDHHVRRDRDDRGGTGGEGRRVEEGDGAAVAVPEEEGPFDTGLAEDLGQPLPGLHLEEPVVGGPGPGVALSEPEPVEDEPLAAEGRAEAVGEVPPEGDRKPRKK